MASAFVRDHVFQNLLEHELFQDNLCKAVEDAYVETDGQYMDVDSAALQDDGCTAITAVLLDKRLVVAHVGDSRGVLAQGDTTVVLTDDHKPNRKDERSRIENAGGQVVWAGTWRVSGVLAVSRSFGNRQMKQVGGLGAMGRARVVAGWGRAGHGASVRRTGEMRVAVC